MDATLLEYIADTDRRRQLAERTKSNPSYLWQIATGRRRASPALAREIEDATAEIGPTTVRKESLRPDLWEHVGNIANVLKRHRRKAS